MVHTVSTRFTAWCETHEVPGPHIRRHHDSALFLQAETSRFFPVSVQKDAADEWGEFLIEHEYCELRLEREWYPAKTGYVPPVEPSFTHRLLEDGTLEPL